MCRFQRALALFHFCTAYHGGQSSPEYACLSRLESVHGFRPSRSEEYASCLAKRENEEARALYVRLATAAEERAGYRRAGQGRGVVSGYIACACCSVDMMADDVDVESGITMCDDCTEGDCDPNQGCNCENECAEDAQDCEVQS